MADKNDWWTSPAESESGRLIMVSGRRDIDKFKSNPKYNIRVEISWDYEGDASGMPDFETSRLMEEATDNINGVLKKDPVAVMTGIFTGDNRREWIFYTLSTNIFGKKINEALQSLPLLPIKIYCENDPDWLGYREMCDLAEINASDSDC